MRLRGVATVGGCLLALLIAGGQALRARAVHAELPRRSEERQREPVPIAPEPVPPGDSDEATVRLTALRALDLLAEASTKSAVSSSLEREATEAGQRLRVRLTEAPRLWPAVTELLCSIDDPRGAIAVLGMIAPAIDDAAENAFIELLRLGPTSQSHRLAVAALGSRSSTRSLDALLSAAQSDPDPCVRFESLRALAVRKPAASNESSVAIDDLLHRRAQGDPEVEVRNAALRLSGLPVSGDVVPPAPRRTSPFGKGPKLASP